MKRSICGKKCQQRKEIEGLKFAVIGDAVLPFGAGRIGIY